MKLNNLMRQLLLTLLLGSSLILGACSQQSEPLSVDEQVDVLDEDLKSVFADQEALDKPLTLSEAMARGILYNLDHRVSVMDAMIAKGEVDIALLEVLPSLDAQGKYIKRDEDNVISARSADSGAQTVPPSIFQEDERTTASLTLGYDVLDAGLAIIDSNTASDKVRIAEERRRKVVHNIIQDVRSAYWRAASAQILNDHIEDLIADGKTMVSELDKEHKSNYSSLVSSQQQMRLLETMHSLTSLKAQLSTAKIELASLINLPPRADYVLAVDEETIFNPNTIPELALDPESLELVALMIRPEIREDILMQRVAARDIRRTTLSALPGLNAFFGYNNDSNDYLRNNDWTEFSMSITGNLINLFTLPVRIEQAKNKEKLTQMRRRALVVAIMSQVNMARLRMDLAQERFDIVRQLASVSRKMRNVVSDNSKPSPSQTLEMDMQAALNRAQLHMAYAEYQNAYGRLLNSIGMDPLPPTGNAASVSEMANVIGQRIDNISPQIFDRLLAYLQERNLQTTYRVNDVQVVHATPKEQSEDVTDIAPAAGVSENTESVQYTRNAVRTPRYND